MFLCPVSDVGERVIHLLFFVGMDPCERGKTVIKVHSYTFMQGLDAARFSWKDLLSFLRVVYSPAGCMVDNSIQLHIFLLLS